MSLFGKDKKKTDAAAPEGRDWFIPEDGREHLQKLFAELKDEVELVLVTREGVNAPYSEYATKFIEDLALLSEKITARPIAHDDPAAEAYDVAHYPSLLIAPDRYRIRFLGAPLGEEGRVFIETILQASFGLSGLSETTKRVLEGLPEGEERLVRVFTSPGCPYCPGAVALAFKSAVELPGRVRAEAVDSAEFEELSQKTGVGAVPHIDFDDGAHTLRGLPTEEQFALELLALTDAKSALTDTELMERLGLTEVAERALAEMEAEAHAGHDHAHGHMHGEGHGDGLEVVEKDLVVLGAGPAGLTAGIYAERAGLSTVLLEKQIVGGLVALTPVVENYPGFANVAGKQLMNVVADHARQYCEIHEGEEVREIKIGKRIEVHTGKAVYLAKAVILSGGATWKKLGAPGEDRYYGHGVNYCASCDGYLYKGKRAAVVGGGNSALTDALHLKNLGVDVTLIHRRDAFRAQEYLIEAVTEANIPVIWNTRVAEMRGDEDKLTSLLLENVETQETTEHATEACFVAIGQKANSQLAQDLGVATSEDGTIVVDRAMRTNIPRIYAAGDVTGGLRQIVTAIGEGATAATSAFEDLAHPYWKKK